MPIFLGSSPHSAALWRNEADGALRVLERPDRRHPFTSPGRRGQRYLRTIPVIPTELSQAATLFAFDVPAQVVVAAAGADQHRHARVLALRRTVDGQGGLGDVGEPLRRLAADLVGLAVLEDVVAELLLARDARVVRTLPGQTSRISGLSWGAAPTKRTRSSSGANRILTSQKWRKQTVRFLHLPVDREREALARGLRCLRPALEHHLVAPRQPRFVEHAVRPYEDHLDDHVDPAGDIGHAVEFSGILVDAKPSRAFDQGKRGVSMSQNLLSWRFRSPSTCRPGDLRGRRIVDTLWANATPSFADVGGRLVMKGRGADA
jgi:hypothetical protein